MKQEFIEFSMSEDGSIVEILINSSEISLSPNTSIFELINESDYTRMFEGIKDLKKRKFSILKQMKLKKTWK